MITWSEQDEGRWAMAVTETHRCVVYYHRRMSSHVVEFERRGLSGDPATYTRVADMAAGRWLAEKLLAEAAGLGVSKTPVKSP